MSKLAVLVITILCALRAFADVVYSGPQNIVYDAIADPGLISLFGAPGTWDDMHPTLRAYPDQSEFLSENESNGDFIDFLRNGGLPKNISAGELIDGSSTYSNNSLNIFAKREEFGAPIIDQGEFRNTTGYAGIKLTDGANIYYGWIQISVTDYDNTNITGTLIDWAYNDTPGASIRAGQKNDFSFVVDSTGALFGANGIEVDGKLYDVRFTDGSCIDLYNGCDTSDDFWFQSEAEATAASNALFAQVFQGTPYDDEPSLTRGCENAEVCKMLTPYEISGTGPGSTATSRWMSNCSPAGIPSSCTADGEVNPPDFPVNRNFDMAGGNETYVVWIPSELDEVEIPFPAGWLFILAPLLLGVGYIRRTTVKA